MRKAFGRREEGRHDALEFAPSFPLAVFRPSPFPPTPFPPTLGFPAPLGYRRLRGQGRLSRRRIGDRYGDGRWLLRYMHRARRRGGFNYRFSRSGEHGHVPVGQLRSPKAVEGGVGHRGNRESTYADLGCNRCLAAFRAGVAGQHWLPARRRGCGWDGLFLRRAARRAGISGIDRGGCCSGKEPRWNWCGIRIDVDVRQISTTASQSAGAGRQDSCGRVRV